MKPVAAISWSGGKDSCAAYHRARTDFEFVCAITIFNADGTRSRFTVGGLLSWPADSRPPGLFAVGGQPRLSLITCTGAYSRSSQTYADRLIVEAGYAGQA